MISEINIIADSKQTINGYNNVLYKDIDNITNGFVSNIICTTLDGLSYEDRTATISSIFKKIGYGGSATLKFINPGLLANQIKINPMDSKKLSDIVSEIKSLAFIDNMISFISQNPDLKIIKQYNDGIFSILHIEKNDK